MADTRRNQSYLGIDSNVLVAYLVPDHPEHDQTQPIVRRKQAVNPTVLHETYHTCVFKLKRKPEDTVQALLDYMQYSLCLSMNTAIVDLGLRFALEYHLGGRDALILASYAMSSQISTLVTFDKSLLDVREMRFGRRKLRIKRPDFTNPRSSA